MFFPDFQSRLSNVQLFHAEKSFKTGRFYSELRFQDRKMFPISDTGIFNVTEILINDDIFRISMDV